MADYNLGRIFGFTYFLQFRQHNLWPTTIWAEIWFHIRFNNAAFTFLGYLGERDARQRHAIICDCVSPPRTATCSSTLTADSSLEFFVTTCFTLDLSSILRAFYEPRHRIDDWSKDPHAVPASSSAGFAMV